MPHRKALQQIDEIIARLRSCQSADCAAAEAEDAELVRLNTLRHTLQAHHNTSIAYIARRYRELFGEERPDIPNGIYRHFKGNLYRVEGLARHSETGEWHVVYRALYGDGGTWIRPAAMFVETVQTASGEMPRFKHAKAEPV